MIEISRRTALAMFGSAGLGVAMGGISMSATESRDGIVDQALPKFSESSRALLRKLLSAPGYNGQIWKGDVAVLAQNEKSSVEELMVNLLPLARSYSYAPISNFFVGVVVRGESESLYMGANIEIPGQCLGFAVHAEQSAISNAYMHLNAPYMLAVNAAPCGHCRQFMEEISPDGELTILMPEKPPTKLSSILPSAFSPRELGMTEGAFPVKEADLKLVHASTDELTKNALVAARKAYAPYSKSHSGVAIRGARGRIYRGSYIENVAFNPSLSPLQVALAAMIAGGEAISAISAAILVEVEGAKISQRSVTEAALGAIAPSVKLSLAVARS